MTFCSADVRTWRDRERREHSSLGSLPLLEDLMMPRRHSHHHLGRVQRARDDAAEVERIRKISRTELENERVRQNAEEQSRRTRLQQELDEAELRRVRALEQFNDSERQRRELQFEDRLRQLEEQEGAVVDPQKKDSMSKRCCKSFKILFGIFLTLGLVFVVSRLEKKINAC